MGLENQAAEGEQQQGSWWWCFESMALKQETAAGKAMENHACFGPCTVLQGQCIV
jgi:hypothetical protein